MGLRKRKGAPTDTPAPSVPSTAPSSTPVVAKKDPTPASVAPTQSSLSSDSKVEESGADQIQSEVAPGQDSDDELSAADLELLLRAESEMSAKLQDLESMLQDLPSPEE